MLCYDLQSQMYPTNMQYILKQSLIESRQELNLGPFDLKLQVWATLLLFVKYFLFSSKIALNQIA